ncbi:hypothetical protein SAY87_024922 [Trapa incisa]|uniref:Uncharacterized protein n=1 Tax=Trapa incisa TaxID=236973 RepID=A0AAN7GGN7_9MYRT|nr:hypothetical protein SAY87_024922 [Trapa incisa]
MKPGERRIVGKCFHDSWEFKSGARCLTQVLTRGILCSCDVCLRHHLRFVQPFSFPPCLTLICFFENAINTDAVRLGLFDSAMPIIFTAHPHKTCGSVDHFQVIQE